MPRKGTVLSEEAQAKNREAIKNWHRENTAKIIFRVRKEKAQLYKELAVQRGQSLSGLIQGFLDEECAKLGLMQRADN